MIQCDIAIAFVVLAILIGIIFYSPDPKCKRFTLPPDGLYLTHWVQEELRMTPDQRAVELLSADADMGQRLRQHIAPSLMEDLEQAVAMVIRDALKEPVGGPLALLGAINKIMERASSSGESVTLTPGPKNTRTAGLWMASLGATRTGFGNRDRVIEELERLTR